jgi:hypothetical protein
MTTDGDKTVHALVNHGGARIIGSHLGLPVIEDRGRSRFAITPTGHTLRVTPLVEPWRGDRRAKMAREGQAAFPAYGDPAKEPKPTHI